MYYLSPKLLNWQMKAMMSNALLKITGSRQSQTTVLLIQLFQLLQAVSSYLYTVTYSLNKIPNYLALSSHTV